eukprot:TRINITY_DN22944_c0_g1_i1.p1 TRINITY_DN22944_c0_g1~~TRINITY_DN22944_c0_g1_i1.p1  ORF type:complete len:448 (+),score=125.92 TRINITY_DN22944_c0_g1_i1:81-1346(+)
MPQGGKPAQPRKSKSRSWRPIILAALTPAVLVVALGVVIALPQPNWLLPDGESPTAAEALVHVRGGEAAFLKLGADPPASSWDAKAQSYNFGRWRRAVPRADLHPLTVTQRLVQRKEWHWVSFTAGPLMIAAAVMQLGYISHVITYWFDASTGRTGKSEHQVPLAGLLLGAKFRAHDGGPSTVVHGCTSWDGPGPMLSMCWDEAASAMRIAVASSTDGGPLRANITVHLPPGEDMLSFVYPLGPRRPAVVTKFAGAAATAVVDTGSGPRVLQGVAANDWTRSLSRRVTIWNWAAASWVDAATGTRIGLQLSRGCYEDSKGRGIESFMSINGTVTPLDDHVDFRLPAKARLAADPWEVESARGAVRYTFTPRDRVHGEFHLGALDGDLWHVWGTMSGTLSAGGTKYHFDKVPGVIEEHYALW